MSRRRELLAFVAALAALILGFLHEPLLGGKVLSPADVLFVSATFDDRGGPLYEPLNRLLMDPVLQFQPWLEFNREAIRARRLPLWNSFAGCGAPHLANGQSAVFDPFHIIAYAGRLPDAYGWMAAARLLAAGVGAFVLARSWGYRAWGRWFAGLCFPFCGFLVVWLQYPVTSSAVWLPWLLWASDGALERPGGRSLALVGLFSGLTLLGGHVQTAAHVLLAAGLYVLWRAWREGRGSPRVLAWGLGIGLGVGLAAIEVVPLAVYLTKSPVWSDRQRAVAPAWSLVRPRLMNAPALALPYLFGSQRRGHPNLARAVGAHNLNETAGGFAGLTPLLWLGPLGLSARGLGSRGNFLGMLVLVGILGALALPPVENLLRALPILNVTDNRRLVLWVTFGLVMLGGAGLDELASRPERRSGAALVVLCTVLAAELLLASAAVSRLEPRLEAGARAHYASAASATPGADPAVYRERARRQVRRTLAFLPRYFAWTAADLGAIAALAWCLRKGWLPVSAVRGGALCLTVLELFGFGLGLNPAIPRVDDRPGGPVVAELRRVCAGGRMLALGEELPPNAPMRYGLRDIRNYDSVELSRSLDWFAPLYEPAAAGRSSRRDVTWAGVARSLDRLREASVKAVLSATPPPPGVFRSVGRVGRLWLAHLDGEPAVASASGAPPRAARISPGSFEIDLAICRDDTIIIRETFDEGWRAEVDGRCVGVRPHRGAFLAVEVPAGTRRLTLRYDPPEVRAAALVSASALSAIVFALTPFRPFRSTRNLARGLDRAKTSG